MKLRAGCRSTTRMRLVGSTAFVLLAATAPSAAAQAPVGHRVENLVVPGSATANEQRKVDVHLWYPANPATAASQPKTVYKSALHGKPVPRAVHPADAGPSRPSSRARARRSIRRARRSR